MTDRWRGRAAGLAVAVAIGLALADDATRSSPELVLHGPSGEVLARVALPADETFTLSYRNSLYRSIAEERFTVTDDGSMRLVALAADELAVLEEYYAIDEPATATHAGERAWAAQPAELVELASLRIAATDLGQRTLLVDGHEPIELWRLVDDPDPSVLLEISG